MSLDISVVITVYNKQEYVERSIISVLEQKHRVKEIVVVDDGSTDDSKDIVYEFAKRYSNLRLITQPNQGVSIARNRGAREALGDLVCFLDADDEWLPCFTQEIAGLAEQCPEASVYTLRHEWVASSGKHIRQRVALPKGFSGIVDNFIDVYRKGYGIIHSSCIGIRKKVFSSYEGFPPGAKKSQDIYFWLTLGLHEKIAFRDVVASLRHEAGSGVTLRKKHVSYHIVSFMDPRHSPNYKTHEVLARFLKKSIFVMILENKLTGNNATTHALLEYGRRFGFLYYFLIFSFSVFPSNLVKKARYAQQSLKRLK